MVGIRGKGKLGSSAWKASNATVWSWDLILGSGEPLRTSELGATPSDT